MSLDVGMGEALGGLVGVLGVWFTYLGVKAKARSDKESTLPEGWKNLTHEMRSFFGEQLEQRDKRIDGLEEKVKTVQRKYRYSLVAIRELKSENPNSKVVIHQEVIEDL